MLNYWYDLESTEIIFKHWQSRKKHIDSLADPFSTMTSTPVSLNDESLEGSWVDIQAASQNHSPIDNEGDSPIMRSPYSMVESVQNLGLISFQVERFLQEAQRNQQLTNSQQNLSRTNNNSPVGEDSQSFVYMSDTDNSLDGFDSKALINSLRVHGQQQAAESNNNDLSYSTPAMQKFLPRRTSKSGDCLVDQLSDSLSLLSRASGLGESNLQDLDWLWDWTDQPEYFTGQEWKVYAPKQEYLMRQRQMYCSDLKRNSEGTRFTTDMASLLFLTNLFSIVIGAGLTYSILARKNGGWLRTHLIWEDTSTDIEDSVCKYFRSSIQQVLPYLTAEDNTYTLDTSSHRIG